ncbi:MAG: hypothetical protein HFH86_04800 [Bacilli bacterium]|nr:hypothetical protein [Bacilli bacterium]
MKYLIVFCFLVLCLSGCEKQNADFSSLDHFQMMDCLEQELAYYVTTEKSQLNNIPFEEIMDSMNEIVYYKGVRADDSNMFVVLETKITYDADIIKNFEFYFSERFPIYQKYVVENEGIYIFFHNSFLDVDWEHIKQKCVVKNEAKIEGKSLRKRFVNQIQDTDQIVIKTDLKEFVIQDLNQIRLLVDEISNGKQYGDTFLCDGPSFEMDLYSQGTLLDTIFLWGDGKRFLPKYMQGGCSYFTFSDFDILEWMEQELYYIIYGIFDYSDSFVNPELIYEDEMYHYYLNGKREQVFVYFSTSHFMMTLEYALNHGYLALDQLERYPDLILKKNKGE